MAGLLPKEVWVFCFENPGVMKPLLEVSDLKENKRNTKNNYFAKSN